MSKIVKQSRGSVPLMANPVRVDKAHTYSVQPGMTLLGLGRIISPQS
jgi:hypothetical protein